MPAMVFKPGSMAVVRGVSVDFERIRTESVDQYCKNGWFKTVEECKHALPNEKQTQQEKQDAEPEAAPGVLDLTQCNVKELKAYAKKIGLKFKANTPKAELLEMVAGYGDS